MLNVVAVYDSASASYASPVFVVSVGVALRSFLDVCLDQRSPIAAHPEHYTLHELATYDPNSGKFENLPQPKWLASASQLIAGAAKKRAETEPFLPNVIRDHMGEPIASVEELRTKISNGQEVK